MALKEGAALQPHQVAGPVSIQTIRGCLEVTPDKGAIAVPAGSLVTFEAGVAHAVRAHDDAGTLITFAMHEDVESA